MQANQKKVKSIIFFCVTAIVVLLTVSVALIVNINLTKNELARQQEQITTLEKQIEYYRNHPSINDEIIQGGN